MRLPEASSTPPADNAEVAAIYARVEARRKPRPLTPLDLALLHNPHIADGWNSFIGAIRLQTSLDDVTREIAICRVAVVNGATYEWGHHAPLALKGGLSEKDIVVLAQPEPKRENCTFTDRQWLVIRYTDAMTRSVRVDDELFAELKTVFEDREAVELTATVCDLDSGLNAEIC